MLSHSFSAQSKQESDLPNLFLFKEIAGQPYFNLIVENKKKGDEYFEKLKNELQFHQLDTSLFTWDPNTFSISITKKNFIHWQKLSLTKKFSNVNTIAMHKRTFFSCGEVFFTIPLNNENEISLARRLSVSAKKFDIPTSFSYNKKDEIIEIASDQYSHYRDALLKKTIPFKKRKFEEDKEKKCHFTLPEAGEHLNGLYIRLRKFLRKKCDITQITTNETLKRVEISNEEFLGIQKLLNKYSQAKILVSEKKFHENDDYFYIEPNIQRGETLDIIFSQTKKYFDDKHKDLNIKPFIDDKNKHVCLSKESYAKWKGNEEKIKNLHEKKFTFDKSINAYVLKPDRHQTLKSLRTIFSRCCEELSLPNFFQKNKKDQQLEVSPENYQLFCTSNIRKKIKKYIAHSIPLTKDDARGVYFFKSPKKYCVITSSFNALARFLDINIKFTNHEFRTEITAEDYNRWIANPFIQELLIQTSANKSSTDNTTNKTKLKISRKQIHSKRNQTVKNTQGWISTKYLEDAFPIPYSIEPNDSHKDHQALLSKGHILPFCQFQNILLKKNDHRYKLEFKLNSQGVHAGITIYSSQIESYKNLFSKNCIFVRAGRKEAASLPTFSQNDPNVIFMMMTREEYNEMENEVSFPGHRMPPQVKLCIIESCSLKKQPQDQPMSYLRASNIKRAVAYAIAKKFDMKDFVLMDDNTTQIQIAENVASEGSLSALFKLFRKYKAKGTVCATLGSYSPNKHITHFLDAVDIEDVNEHLGSKIMYVDFEYLKHKLTEKNKKVHELLSPYSLWWGEDYFNMLAIIQLIEEENKTGIMGVVPFNVAWHIRSQNNRNKEKSNNHFRLANVWLNNPPEFFENLSQHQQQVVIQLKDLVARAVTEQKAKEEKYFKQLQDLTATQPESAPSDDVSLEIAAAIAVDSTIQTAAELGKQHGIQSAKRGYALNLEKLTASLKNKCEAEYAQAYRENFQAAHQTQWDALSQAARAYGRGFQEGYQAAILGYQSGSTQSIPALYQDQAPLFLKGFNKANEAQWKAMEEIKDINKIQLIANAMGTHRAKTGYKINEAKLEDIASHFGENTSNFKQYYRDAFDAVRSAINEDLVIKDAATLAKKLFQQVSDLDLNKLHSASKKFGLYCKLYEKTVMNEFKKLQTDKPSSQKIASLLR